MDDTTSYLEDCGKRTVPELRCGAYYARKRGSGHIAGNKPCQDYCIVKEIAPDLLFAAAADGHGGEKYTRSDAGARLACEVLADLAEQIYVQLSQNGACGEDIAAAFGSRALKVKFVERWRQAVEKDYREHPGEECSVRNIIRKYGTTILFAAVTGKYFVLGQLGDGAILLFDHDGHAQLFKRHPVKVEAKTSSLASERAVYAFFTDVYERNLFDSILLSTDGIYDKLDQRDSFLRYAEALAARVKKQEEPIHPFTVEDIDVSAKTGDDCTVVLLQEEAAAAAEERPDGPEKADLFAWDALEASGYEKIRFQRVCCETVILSAEKGGQIYEIHIGGEHHPGPAEGIREIPGCRLLSRAEEILMGGGRAACSYVVREGTKNFFELYENGEMLEKRYLSRAKEEEEADSRYSNEFWLKVYENAGCLERHLAAGGLYHTRDFVRTLRISDDGTLYCYDDGIRREAEESAAGGNGIDEFRAIFAFLGKIRCGKLQCPLYECMDQGQTVKFLHLDGGSAPMLRVSRNRKKQIYGLWNISDRPWMVKYPGEREIAPGEVLRLTGGQTFFVACTEGEALPEADPSGGFVRYEVELF